MRSVRDKKRLRQVVPAGCLSNCTVGKDCIASFNQTTARIPAVPQDNVETATPEKVPGP